MHLPVDQLEDLHVGDSDEAAAPVNVERESPDRRVVERTSERRSEALRWVISFMIVAACHGVGAVALVSSVSEPPSAGADAPVVMLDLPEALAPSPVRDLPPGPLIEDYVAPTPPPPKEETKPPETEAEVALPKLEPEPPKPPEPPAEEILPSAPAAARTPSNAVLRWQSKLGAHIDRFKRYPAAARRGGTAAVAFTIDRQGHLLQSSIVQSAGSPTLDQEALATLARAVPMPRPPDDVTDAELTFIISVHFDDR
jgi:periplasmic protein TonB